MTSFSSLVTNGVATDASEISLNVCFIVHTAQFNELMKDYYTDDRCVKTNIELQQVR